MEAYGGIDLHSNNNIIALTDEQHQMLLLPDQNISLALKSNLMLMGTLSEAITQINP
uniref:Transposase n=1 Tax=Candidatus Kentrum sp. TC TaxID=2126339 RepID=A0A450YRN1_9GAMM|nr:MAG: hypothetical protein BECKTC1821E_GA0114239_10329 [Candidatus Kentron sp. TC]